MIKLGVNIDHIATIREARKTIEPDPVLAADECESAGCDGIVCHLRKDRRHIQDDDVIKLKETVKTHLNLEMSVDEEIVGIALGIKPDQATLVPENRQEVTTEGGLDVAGNFDIVKSVVSRLEAGGIHVSLFIDPVMEQIEASKETGAGIIEFHTGRYAEEFLAGRDCSGEVDCLRKAVSYAVGKGMLAAAGHGLTYQNISGIKDIKDIFEYNIGHSIVARAAFTGMKQAVIDMRELIK